MFGIKIVWFIWGMVNMKLCIYILFWFFIFMNLFVYNLLKLEIKWLIYDFFCILFIEYIIGYILDGNFYVVFVWGRNI